MIIQANLPPDNQVFPSLVAMPASVSNFCWPAQEAIGQLPPVVTCTNTSFLILNCIVGNEIPWEDVPIDPYIGLVVLVLKQLYPAYKNSMSVPSLQCACIKIWLYYQLRTTCQQYKCMCGFISYMTNTCMLFRFHQLNPAIKTKYNYVLTLYKGSYILTF